MWLSPAGARWLGYLNHAHALCVNLNPYTGSVS